MRCIVWSFFFVVLVISALFPGPLVARRLAVPSSVRVAMPSWLDRPEVLPLYIRRKYFQDPDACETIKDTQWICHMDCGEHCRIDTLFDFSRRVEVMLPRTEANYFHVPKWQLLIGVAFMPSGRGFDLSWVWTDLNTLMLRQMPTTSGGEYQTLSDLQIFTAGKSERAEAYYCLPDDRCFHDEIEVRRAKLLVRKHELIERAEIPTPPISPMDDEADKMPEPVVVPEPVENPPKEEAPILGVPIEEESSHAKKR